MCLFMACALVSSGDSGAERLTLRDRFNSKAGARTGGSELGGLGVEPWLIGVIAKDVAGEGAS